MEEVTLLLGQLTLTVRGHLAKQGRDGDGDKPDDNKEPETPRKGGAPTREPEPEGEDWRYYCVTANPHAPDSVAIWYGPHPRCWNRLRGNLRGARLAGSGASLSRHATLQEAKQRWAAAWHSGMPGTAARPPLIQVA